MRAASIAWALGVFTSGLFSGLPAVVLFLLPASSGRWHP
jgi:hypothetical protein